MRRWGVWLLLLTILNGCTFIPLIRTEFATGSPFAVAKVINDNVEGFRSNGWPKAALPMDGYYTSIKGGIHKDITEDFNLSLALGPAIFIPSKGPRGNYYSLDFAPRISYISLDLFYPYVEGLVGIGRLEHRWLGEATKHQFTIGGTLGVTVPIIDYWKLDFGYRIYHISNGSAIFGTRRPNVGYNTDLFIFGIQYDF